MATSERYAPHRILVAKSLFTLALRGIQAQNPPSGRAVQTRWQADLYGRGKCNLSCRDPHSRWIHMVLTRMMGTMSLMFDFATSIPFGARRLLDAWWYTPKWNAMNVCFTQEDGSDGRVTFSPRTQRIAHQPRSHKRHPTHGRHRCHGSICLLPWMWRSFRAPA